MLNYHVCETFQSFPQAWTTHVCSKALRKLCSKSFGVNVLAIGERKTVCTLCFLRSIIHARMNFFSMRRPWSMLFELLTKTFQTKKKRKKHFHGYSLCSVIFPLCVCVCVPRDCMNKTREKKVHTSLLRRLVTDNIRIFAHRSRYFTEITKKSKKRTKITVLYEKLIFSLLADNNLSTLRKTMELLNFSFFRFFNLFYSTLCSFCFNLIRS